MPVLRTFVISPALRAFAGRKVLLALIKGKRGYMPSNVMPAEYYCQKPGFMRSHTFSLSKVGGLIGKLIHMVEYPHAEAVIGLVKLYLLGKGERGFIYPFTYVGVKLWYRRDILPGPLALFR